MNEDDHVVGLATKVFRSCLPATLLFGDCPQLLITGDQGIGALQGGGNDEAIGGIIVLRDGVVQ